MLHTDYQRVAVQQVCSPFFICQHHCAHLVHYFKERNIISI